MRQSEYKKNLILLFFFIFGLTAKNVFSAPALYKGKEQIAKHPVATEFVPFQVDEQTKALFSVNRFFQTEFTIQNTGPSYKNRTILWCYLPVSNGYDQIVPKVTTSDKAKIFRDNFGNLFLRFELNDIPPYAIRIVRVDCEVLKGGQAIETENADREKLKKYLAPEELLEADHVKIIEVARKLRKKDSVQTAKKIFDWVMENLTYSGYDKQDKGALHGLTFREGDCTEQAALFTALCRASDIPAKLIWGYRCQGNCQGGERLHTWSEFFADGAWHLADITNRVFDKEYENYIGLVNYHGVDPNPLKKKHRYRMDFTYEDVKTRIDVTSVVRLH